MANSKLLVSQIRSGDFTVEEFGHRAIVGMLWVVAVAVTLTRLSVQAAQVYGPPALAFTKKLLTTIANGLPEIEQRPTQEAQRRLPSMP